MGKQKIPYEEIEKLLIDFIGDTKPSQRVEMIDDFIHRLKFERRWWGLTEEERDNMLSNSLSSAERTALDRLANNKPAFDEKIEEFARARYFRHSAWENYLNGTGPKPFSSVKPCSVKKKKNNK